MLRPFERELREEGWRRIRPDLEVKLCQGPDSSEVFALCRSGARREKEEAMLERFAERIETGLQRIQQSCLTRPLTQAAVGHRVGALLTRNKQPSRPTLRHHPAWHQKTERVEAHILVCFLAFVLWKTLEQTAKAAGRGDSCRKILDELAAIRTVDVVMKTRQGQTIRRRCVTRPTDHQAILLRAPRHPAAVAASDNGM